MIRINNQINKQIQVQLENWHIQLNMSDQTKQEYNVINFDLIARILLIGGVIYAFHQMLIHDRTAMKVSFAFAFLLSLFIASGNKQCARTAPFLLNLICLQIIMMGLVMIFKNSIASYLIKKYKGKEVRINLSSITFAIILLLLALTSGIGLLYSIYNNYYLELIQKEIAHMLSMVFLAFLIVAIADYFYTRFNEENVKITTRRKIFHFVPVALLPVLVLIKYKLFTLMAFGSFYLFWLLEIIRYFGKMARKQDNQMISFKDKSSPLFITNFECKMVHFTVKFIEILHQLNLRLSKLAFIQWMQSLNESRQPYFWFTHLSLILGLCVTYIYYPPSALSQREDGIKQHISVILVVSDAMAAIIGRRYGKKKHIVPCSNNKTLEGYVGYIITAILLQIIASYLLLVTGQSPIIIDFKFIVLSSALCGIGELFSADLDNIICGFIFIAFDRLYNSLFSS